MSSFLLLLSFVLNGIAILAIINLYLRQNRLAETEKKLDKTFQEMEGIISSYLFEMKEENEVFMKRLQQMNIDGEIPKAATSYRQTAKDHVDIDEPPIRGEQTKKPPTRNDEPVFPRIEHTSRLQAINTYKKTPTFASTVNDGLSDLVEQEARVETKDEITPSFQHMQRAATEEVSLYEEITTLKKKGFTADEIAKKLSRGKTEVELILKLNRNE